MFMIKIISVIVLIRLEVSETQTCENPWKKDLGLTGSKKDLENLSRIQSEFMKKIYNSTLKDHMTVAENINADLIGCNTSSKCRVYTVIDKGKENSMILCIMANNIPKCYALSCFCEREKDRKTRAVKTDVTSDSNQHGKIEDLKTLKCSISVVHEQYLPKTKCINTTTNQDISYSKEYTTHPDRETSSCVGDSSKDKVLVEYFWLFPLGCVIGALMGVVGTCVWFKRKTFSSINPTHTRRENANEEHSLLNGAEYSEIPVNLQFFEISSKERNEKQTVQRDANLQKDKVSLPPVHADKNNVNCQREISIQMRNPKFNSKTVKESDADGYMTPSQRKEEWENRDVYETCIESDDVTTKEKGFLTQNVDPGKPEYVYHILEDIPKDDRDKIPTQWSEKEMEYPCVSQTGNDNADVRMEQKESQYVNPVNPCNIYHTVEDTRNVEKEEGGNKTPDPTSTSEKSPVTEALYFVLSAQTSIPIERNQTICREDEIYIPDA